MQDISVTLHDPANRFNFNLEVDNIGVGTVSIDNQCRLNKGGHAHVNNMDGVNWIIVSSGIDSESLGEVNNITDSNAYSLTSGGNTNLHFHSYTHDQILSSAVWVINHNLGKYPSITVVDTANNMVVGDISYASLNQAIITFIAEFSGIAYLN